MYILMLIFLIPLNFLFLLLNFLALPGNWLIVVSAFLYAWMYNEQQIFSKFTLAFILILAILGEIIEFFAGAGGARKAGSSWFGSIGALIGTFIGAIMGTVFIPVVFIGTLAGASLGAALGAWSIEFLLGHPIEEVRKRGFGAGLGVLVGTTTKFLLGFVICVTLLIAAIWP